MTTDLALIESMRRELAAKQVDTFLQEMASLGYTLQGALAEVAAKIRAAEHAGGGENSGSAADAKNAGRADTADPADGVNTVEDKNE